MGKGSKQRPCDEKKVADNWPFKDRFELKTNEKEICQKKTKKQKQK